MGVECTGRNVEVAPSVEELARQRTERLERHLGGVAQVRVVLSREKHRFGAEVIATFRRRLWKAEEETADPRTALALAFEKIDAQAKKDLEKIRGRKRRELSGPMPGSRQSLEEGGETWGTEARSEFRIVRGAQRSPAKPMSAEEAALRLDGSRQEFLVFRNSSNEKISVLYRRRDGHFGLIVPEC